MEKNLWQPMSTAIYMGYGRNKIYYAIENDNIIKTSWLTGYPDSLVLIEGDAQPYKWASYQRAETLVVSAFFVSGKVVYYGKLSFTLV